MKQFLLYLLYVAILFVIQMAVLGLLSLADGPNQLRDVIYLFYFVPAGLIISFFMIAFGNDSLNLLPQGWFFLEFLAGIVALIYALVIGAILWGITFIILLIRKNAIAKKVLSSNGRW